MARMPSWSRDIQEWADYLLDEGMSVWDAIDKTSSEAVASWLDDKAGEIQGKMGIYGGSVEMNASNISFLDDEDLDEYIEDAEDDDTSPPLQTGVRI